jgi:uncharacterized protein (TIGR02246 family)
MAQANAGSREHLPESLCLSTSTGQNKPLSASGASNMVFSKCAVVGLVALLLPLPLLQAQVSNSKLTPAVVSKSQDDRPEDRESIKATVKVLTAAYDAGDAAAIAALLTEGAELQAEDAPPIQGRKAIQEALKQQFEKKQKQKIIVEPESLRFISRDTAVEVGQLRTSQQQQAWVTKRYTLMFVREEGKWLIGTLSESTSEQAPLRDLDWLIGSWQAKRDDLSIENTYEWVGNKAFIRGHIVTRQKDRTITAMQVIGLDPKTGTLRIWIFESNGIFAQGNCHRDENAWIFETAGESPEGMPVSAKNILLHVNQNTMTWQPVQLRMGNEQIADLPPIKVTRVKK